MANTLRCCSATVLNISCLAAGDDSLLVVRSLESSRSIPLEISVPTVVVVCFP